MISKPRPPRAPGSDLAQCCLDAKASGKVDNRRPWPGENFDFGECPECGSSISVKRRAA